MVCSEFSKSREIVKRLFSSSQYCIYGRLHKCKEKVFQYFTLYTMESTRNWLFQSRIDGVVHNIHDNLLRGFYHRLVGHLRDRKGRRWWQTQIFQRGCWGGQVPTPQKLA